MKKVNVMVHVRIEHEQYLLFSNMSRENGESPTGHLRRYIFGVANNNIPLIVHDSPSIYRCKNYDTVNINMDKEVYSKFKNLCNQKNKTVSNCIRDYVYYRCEIFLKTLEE